MEKSLKKTSEELEKSNTKYQRVRQRSDGSDNVWLEEVVEEPVRPTKHRRHKENTGEESPLEKLVQSISSDDSWVENGSQENGSRKERRIGRKTSVKTYHDPTIETIHETNGRRWNWYDGESSESDEVTTSENITSSAADRGNISGSDEHSNESLEKSAISLPIVLLRLLRGGNKKDSLSSRKRTNDASSREENTEANAYTSTPQDNDKGQHGTVEKVQGRNVENFGGNANGEQGDEKGAENFFTKINKKFHKEFYRKEGPSLKKNTQDKFCPLCGQSLGKIHLPEAFQQKNGHEEQGFEGRLTSAKMWRALWVDAGTSPDAQLSNKVYRTELRVNVDGRKTLTESLFKGMEGETEIAKYLYP